MTRQCWNFSSFDLLMECTFSNINLFQIFKTLTEGASSDLSRESIAQLVLPREEELVIDLSKPSLICDEEPLIRNFESSCAGKMHDMETPTTNHCQAPSRPIAFFDPQRSALNEKITIRSISKTLSLSQLSDKFELFTKFLKSNSDQKLKLQKLPNKNRQNYPKYTDQVFAIAIFQAKETAAQKLTPKNKTVPFKAFAAISGWMFIPRTDESLAYSCLDLDSKYHGSLVVDSEEYKEFLEMFDHVDIHKVPKTCDSFGSVPEVGLDYIQGRDKGNLTDLSAELRYVNLRFGE